MHSVIRPLLLLLFQRNNDIRFGTSTKVFRSQGKEEVSPAEQLPKRHPPIRPVSRELGSEAKLQARLSCQNDGCLRAAQDPAASPEEA